MNEPKRLTPDELRDLFGITPLPELTDEEREECTQINALFDAVTHECGLRERAIFEGAYPTNPKRAHKKMFMFLKDVRSCPPKVIGYAQQLLNEHKK